MNFAPLFGIACKRKCGSRLNCQRQKMKLLQRWGGE
jgi:hypothetical protein